MSHPGSKRPKWSQITSFFKKKETDVDDDAGEDYAHKVQLDGDHDSDTSDHSDVIDDKPSTPEDDNAQEAHENDTVIDNPTSLSHTKPNHPPARTIPPKETKSQKIYFQTKWFETYPWLHYDETHIFFSTW